MKDADSQIIATLREILARTGGGAATAWGAITGTLSAQTDLASALLAKQSEAQVQALIDAAIAGKGVIGTASFKTNGNSIEDLVMDGGIDSVSYLGVGQYLVHFTSVQPDTKYNAPVSAGNDASINLAFSTRSASSFTVFVYAVDGTTPTDDSKYVSCSALRVSQ